MSLDEIARLKKEFGANKVIPAGYEKQILTALSYYPELKNTRIHFRLSNNNPVPYNTLPSVTSILKPPSRRLYFITLLEKAKEPERSALFKNLAYEAQVAVIAHELIHVIQFSKRSILSMIKFLMVYPMPLFKKRIERAADIGAIEHGLGQGLYKHAVYLRSIPGYTQKRPEINKYYLKPDEIMERLNLKSNEDKLMLLTVFNYKPQRAPLFQE